LAQQSKSEDSELLEHAPAAQESVTGHEEGKLLFLYGVGVVGMFSLVLVLLQIERNTRRQ
jgi:hypothetical protein